MRHYIILFIEAIKRCEPRVRTELEKISRRAGKFLLYLAVVALFLAGTVSLLTYHAWRNYRETRLGTMQAVELNEQFTKTVRDKELPKSASGGSYTPIPQTEQSRQDSAGIAAAAKEKHEATDTPPPSTEVKQEKMVKPLAGNIVSAYGWREDQVHKDWRFFPGVDIRAARGSAVHAAKSGKVSDISRGSGGLVLKMDHSGGMSTVYGNVTDSGLQVGQFVEQGQNIGRLGSDGEPNLHFEIWQDKRSIDPSELFRD